MAIALAQVRIPYDTGNPADLTVNTFTFITPGANVEVADANDIVARLTDFYDDIHAPATAALRTYWGSGVDQANFGIKVYDQGDVPPRAPVADERPTMGAPGTTVEPTELCATLSFQGIRQSGQIQARRRGRIYFGPLATIAFTSTYPIRLSAGFISTANACMEWLAQPFGSAIGGPNIQWCVYSRTNDSAVDVDNGWVDNAIDIQRRRGEAPSLRTTWG